MPTDIPKVVIWQRTQDFWNFLLQDVDPDGLWTGFTTHWFDENAKKGDQTKIMSALRAMERLTTERKGSGSMAGGAIPSILQLYRIDEPLSIAEFEKVAHVAGSPAAKNNLRSFVLDSRLKDLTQMYNDLVGRVEYLELKTKLIEARLKKGSGELGQVEELTYEEEIQNGS